MCWAWEIGRLTHHGGHGGYGNAGRGSCGTLPEGFVCEPGASGPGVFDMDLRVDWYVPDLRQFGGITCITGNLRMENTSLANLAGFETLVAVGGDVEIQNNPVLTSVSGLQSLKSAGALSIVSNPVLTSLAGLADLRSLGSPPTISENALLPACWAERVAQQVGQPCSCGGNSGSEACQ